MSLEKLRHCRLRSCAVDALFQEPVENAAYRYLARFGQAFLEFLQCRGAYCWAGPSLRHRGVEAL